MTRRSARHLKLLTGVAARLAVIPLATAGLAKVTNGGGHLRVVDNVVNLPPYQLGVAEVVVGLGALVGVRAAAWSCAAVYAGGSMIRLADRRPHDAGCGCFGEAHWRSRAVRSGEAVALAVLAGLVLADQVANHHS